MILISELIIIFVLLACYYFIFWDKPRAMDNEAESTKQDNAAGILKNLYTAKQVQIEDEVGPKIKAEIEVSNNIVNIKQDIFLKDAVDAIHLYIPSYNALKITLKNVSAERGLLNIIRGDHNLKVDFEEKQDKIHLEYEIVLDKKRDTLSYSDNFIFLTNFLITPAVYKNGAPLFVYKSSFGDPYLYDINNYDIKLTTDKRLQIYAPGKIDEQIIGREKITVFQAENIRDFPIILFRNAEVHTEKYGDIDIYYIDAYAAKDYVESALQFASSNIGPYPYKELLVVKAPLLQKGMEFSNTIFIGDDCFDNQEVLKRVTYHEVLHQWFYGIIGTDQLNEPFFDEGLVNYLALMLSNSQITGYYNPKLFQLQLKDYSSKDEYYRLVYYDSAVYFYTLHKKMGDDFFKLLQRIYAKGKFSIVYFDEFLNYTKEFLGGN